MQITKIYNSKWYRGKGSIYSFLIGPKGYCCLGFDGLCMGVDEEKLFNSRTPFDFPLTNLSFNHKWRQRASFNLIDQLPDYIKLSIASTQLADIAMKINDYELISDTERLRLLRIVFKEADTRIIYYKDK